VRVQGANGCAVPTASAAYNYNYQRKSASNADISAICWPCLHESSSLVSWLEIDVPFQQNIGYIGSRVEINSLRGPRDRDSVDFSSLPRFKRAINKVDFFPIS